MLYGSAPDYPQHRASDWGLAPTMTLSTRLLATQTLAPGDTVGYGSTFVAQRPMRIGVVACGYADGYPRHARGSGDAHATPVLVEGVRCPLVGRVSMDMLTVDLEPVDAVRRQRGQAPVEAGAEVVLWGHSSHGSVLPIDEVAHSAGTIAYELMCAVAPRVPFK
jgi:alanine racemase